MNKLTSIFLLLFSLSGYSQIIDIDNGGVTAREVSDSVSQIVHDSLDALDDINGDLEIEGDLTYEMIHYWRIGWGLDENDGLTFGGDSITIITPGDYKILRMIFNYSVYSFTLAGANTNDFKVDLFKNNVKLYGVRRTTTGAGNYAGGTLAFYLVHLVAGDDLSVRVCNMTAPGTNDPTFTNLNWFFYKIPE